jgi:hypothetical protein
MNAPLWWWHWRGEWRLRVESNQQHAIEQTVARLDRATAQGL